MSLCAHLLGTSLLRRGRQQRARARVNAAVSVVLEALESRQLLATFTGTVFLDKDLDGILDVGEKGIPGMSLAFNGGTYNDMPPYERADLMDSTSSGAGGSYSLSAVSPFGTGLCGSVSIGLAPEYLTTSASRLVFGTTSDIDFGLKMVPKPPSCGCRGLDKSAGTANTSSGGTATDASGTDLGTQVIVSNDPKGALGGNANGNNVTPANFNLLVQQGDSIVTIDASGGMRWFDPDGGNFVGRYGVTDELTHDGTNNLYNLIGGDGSRTTYYDFDGSYDIDLRGKIKSWTGPGGQHVDYTYGVSTALSSEALGSMTWSTTKGTVTTKEYFAYDYLSSGDNDGKVDTVTLKRKTWDTALSQSEGSVSFSTERVTAYGYYGTSSDDGNLGDLQSVQVKDASGNVLNTDYFRYYTDNMLLFSAEIRRTVWVQKEDRGLDINVWSDVGQGWGDSRSKTNPFVIENDQFDSSNWRASFGGGVTYRFNKGLAFRVDFASSYQKTTAHFNFSRGF